MSKVKGEWIENEKELEEANELFEEMYQHSKEGEFETIEQLESDLEDLRSDAVSKDRQLEDLKDELKEITHERDRLLQQLKVLNTKYMDMWTNK